MFTNTYLPHVGGVARSVNSFEEEFRRRGHDVRIIAPTFEGYETSTENILRVPAIQNFNGSDFSVRIPQPFLIADYIDDFSPDIIHSHHPFLLGDAALRTAWRKNLPLFFTHHTLYEQYTHYVPLDSLALQRVAIQMATEYSNRCTQVIAPSESIAQLLSAREVVRPIQTIPTGIDYDRLGNGDGQRFRERHRISKDTLVVGHVGRLANEKNLAYLARAVAIFLEKRADATWLVIGDGEFKSEIQQAIESTVGSKRLILTGSLTGKELFDGYAAMDVFVFSSQSETQGLVVVEAMAAGSPVVALDGPGVRDAFCKDCGYLLPSDTKEEEFADAILKLTRDPVVLQRHGDLARKYAQNFKVEVCADRMLDLYQHHIELNHEKHVEEPGTWDAFLNRLSIEWELLVEKSAALAAALVETNATNTQLQ
jgi:1,2-diacylglycerol 3-alpha-glucosyltransferase